MRTVGKVLYWLAVLAISLALLVALVLFFESRDDSNLRQGGDSAVGSYAAAPSSGGGSSYAGSTLSSFANTTIRCAAL